MSKRIARLLAEFIGTFAFVFIGAGAAPGARKSCESKIPQRMSAWGHER